LDARPVVAVVQIVYHVLVAHEKLLGILIAQTKKIGKDLSAGIADPLAHRGILEQELKGQSDAVKLG